MAEIAKPILLDETGKEIVKELQEISNSIVSGTPKSEKVVFVLRSEVEGVNVNNVGINIFFNGDTTNPLTCVTDDRGMCSVEIPIGYRYLVTFPQFAGCAEIQPVQLTAVLRERSIEVVYDAKTEKMEHRIIEVFKQVGNDAPTRFAGCNVHIDTDAGTQTLTTDNNGIAEAYIPYGTEYTIRMDDLHEDGWYIYGQRYKWRYTAGSTETYKAVRYHDVSLGLFIVDKDGGQYSLAQWKDGGHNNEDAILVRFVTANLVVNNATFSILLDDIANGNYADRQYANPNKQCGSFGSGYSYEGLRRTELLIADGDTNSYETPAADYCYSKTVEIGGETIQGFLGSVNQHIELYSNEAALDEIFRTVRPTASRTVSAMCGAWKWAVDYSNASDAFPVYRSVSSRNRGSDFGALAFYAL